MLHATTKRLSLVLIAAIMGLFTTAPASATTYDSGNTLINRAVLDGGLGNLFAAEAFGFDEGTVTQYSIRSTAAAYAGTRNLTPVILEQTGVGALSAMTIRGIGTTQNIAHTAAVQTFDFGLVSGSAAMGPRHYFGWVDGNAAGTSNAGTISYSDGGVNCCTLWYGGHPTLSNGEVVNLASNLGRTYSLQTTIDIGDNQVVGNSPNQRFTLESGTGGVFIMEDAFESRGRVTEWATWTFTNGTNKITPLLFENVGGTYVLRGVGETKTPAATQGSMTYGFDLVSGSDLVDSNFFFGWVDGSISADGTPTYNAGSIRYDTSSFAVSGRWFGNSPALDFDPGTNVGAGTALPRFYAIQAIAVPIPEPATVSLALMGLGGLMMRRRRMA